MKNKTAALFALAALAATTFNVNAAATYEPFVGIDAGARLSGQAESKYDGKEDHLDLKSSTVFGVEGGVILNQAHQFSIGYDYRGVSVDYTDDDLEVGTLYTQYDYLVPITQKLAWTIGGKLGYEMYNSDFDNADELNGVVLGAQTGLNYRFNAWSVGTEVSYLYHTHEFESSATYNGQTETSSYKIGDEVLLTANVKYHF
ncbi:transcriptional regulator [Vibrio campbellii]|uniref:outer membrane beta-barrel protein n=1 Tax=Vibrio campbellii TaxID=680 RepID=UPI00026C4EF9|nr:outer membrane beta-barrel protein [Vibrio campbellii]AXB34276.1 transcriptional regulator [Vibrio campbellii]